MDKTSPPNDAAPLETYREWRCAGCGAQSQNRIRACYCPTGVIYRGTEMSTKIDPPPFPYPRGVLRAPFDRNALLIFFDDRPDDDQLRAIHEALKAPHGT